MKVKCILKEGITGIGYENMKFEEEREVKKDIGDLLINFGYVLEIKKKNKKEE